MTLKIKNIALFIVRISCMILVVCKLIDIAKKVMRIYRNVLWCIILKKCGESVEFRKGLVIWAPKNVIIGSNVSIWEFVHINALGGVNIGNNVMIATFTAILTATHDYSNEQMYLSLVTKPINIGDDVWIGANALILPGVTIGPGAVIGAGSVVTNSIPSNAISYGVPAKIIGYRTIEK